MKKSYLTEFQLLKATHICQVAPVKTFQCLKDFLKAIVNRKLRCINPKNEANPLLKGYNKSTKIPTLLNSQYHTTSMIPPYHYNSTL